MLIDIPHVPDVAVKFSESREHGVIPGVDYPIHRVRLQGNDLTGKQSDRVAEQLREFAQADFGECTLYVRHNPASTILKELRVTSVSNLTGIDQDHLHGVLREGKPKPRLDFRHAGMPHGSNFSNCFGGRRVIDQPLEVAGRYSHPLSHG